MKNLDHVVLVPSTGKLFGPYTKEAAERTASQISAEGGKIVAVPLQLRRWRPAARAIPTFVKTPKPGPTFGQVPPMPACPECRENMKLPMVPNVKTPFGSEVGYCRNSPCFMFGYSVPLDHDKRTGCYTVNRTEPRLRPNPSDAGRRHGLTCIVRPDESGAFYEYMGEDSRFGWPEQAASFSTVQDALASLKCLFEREQEEKRTAAILEQISTPAGIRPSEAIINEAMDGIEAHLFPHDGTK